MGLKEYFDSYDAESLQIDFCIKNVCLHHQILLLVEKNIYLYV